MLRSCWLHMSTPDSLTPSTVEYTKLISLAVHEMRTPTSVVVGYLRMLLNDASAPLSDRQRRMIGEAEKACERLVVMLGEFSDVGKLDAGTAVIKDERFDLFELAKSVGESVHEPLDREVGLETRGIAVGGMFQGDRARIQSLLTVVVRAVVREQPAGTTVVLDVQPVTRDGRSFARIVVAPEPDLARASETEPSEFDDRRGGLGLGLPLGRRVVARYGGLIWSPTPPDDRPLPIGSRGAIALLLPLTALTAPL